MKLHLTSIIILILIFNLKLSAQITLSKNQINKILEIHNFYRKIVGVDSLKWSENLEKKAQIFANQFTQNPLITQNQFNLGQNIALIKDTSQIYSAIHNWANEQIYYYGQQITQQNLPLFQHYTQIIWCNTTHIGCAIAQMKYGWFIFVCLYEPKGNQIGQSPTNCK